MLKIYDIVLMSAIDAIDIDARRLRDTPRFLLLILQIDDGVRVVLREKYDEGIPGECPVLLCFDRDGDTDGSLATKGALTTKRKRTTTTMSAVKLRQSSGGKRHEQILSAQSRDDRVFVLCRFFQR